MPKSDFGVQSLPRVGFSLGVWVELVEVGGSSLQARKWRLALGPGVLYSSSHMQNPYRGSHPTS